MRLLFSTTTVNLRESGLFARRRTALLVVFVLISSAGCFSSSARQAQELLEADLRSQERHIQELKEELDRKEGVIHSLDYDVERLQQSAAGVKPPGEPPAPGVIKDIALGRLTGGYQQNPKIRFDDSLQVLLEPRDSDGHAIKVPGSVHVDLFEITPQGLKAPLSSWDITQRELRRMWDQPLIGGPGYRIVLPFKAIPTTEKLRVIVRFTTLDGKLYEAERDFTIKLPMGVPRPGLPIGTPGGYSVITPGRFPAPIVTTEPSVLPMPKRSEPVKPITHAPEAKLAAPEEKKAETPSIPVIQFPSLPNSPGGKESQSETVPPLPPPPEIPTLESNKPGKPAGVEILPAPHSSPESDKPLTPGNNTASPQAAPKTGTPLTAPPPQSWRERHSGIIQAEHSDEQLIKLSRPIAKSQPAPE